MNMTENRQLMLTVLDNNIKGDRGPYYKITEIEYALETAYKLAGIYNGLKKVPSYQQIQCTLQDLIVEGLVYTTTLPEHEYTDRMIDYYALISQWEAGRDKLICRVWEKFAGSTENYESDIFYLFGGFCELHPEELPLLLLRTQLFMEKTYPDISKVYFEEQFSQMKECIAWINDVIPFPTDKPHSPLVTEKAKHLSNLDPDYV